jgi:hypothetical protein
VDIKIETSSGFVDTRRYFLLAVVAGIILLFHVYVILSPLGSDRSG